MKTAFTLVGKSLAIFLITLSTAYGQTWDWALSMGNTSTSGDYSEDIAVDSEGNSYCTGFFLGNGIFGDTNMVTNGSADIFIVKLDINGELIWARSPGGDFSDSGLAIEVDSNDDVILTGFFSNIGQFGNHLIAAVAGQFQPRKDCFVAKYHKDGDCLWVKNITNSAIDDELADVAVDSQNNVYVIGAFADSLVTPDTIIVAEQYGDDFFVIKYDCDGNYQWIKHGDTPETDIADLGISISKQDVIYIKGYFKGDLSYNSLLVHTDIPNSWWSAFLMRIDADGNEVWNEIMDQLGIYIPAGAITTDKNGNCILSLNYRYGLTLSDTVLTCEDRAVGIMKYNSQGDRIWTTQITSFNAPLLVNWYFNGLTTDDFGNTYVYGHTSSNFTYGDETLMNWELKSFVVSLNNTGEFTGVKSGGNIGKSIVCHNEELFVVGESYENVPTVFDNLTLPPIGLVDVVVAKLSGFVQEACSNQNQILAFPNPSSDEVRISHNLCGAVKLQIFDYSGQLAMEKSCLDCGGFTIFRGAIASGTYIAVVSNGEDRESLRIIFN